MDRKEEVYKGKDQKKPNNSLGLRLEKIWQVTETAYKKVEKERSWCRISLKLKTSQRELIWGV